VHGFPVGLFQCENNVIGIPGVGSGGFRHVLEKYIKAKAYCQAPFEKVKKRKVLIEGERIAATFTPPKQHPARGNLAEALGNAWGEGNARGSGTGTGTGTTARPNRREQLARLVCTSATSLRVEPESVDAVFTDPPYYDNVQYAELIDFCYVWLRRLVRGVGDGFDTTTTRAAEELTGNRTGGRGIDDFCRNLSRSFCRASEALKRGGLFVFTYHHNSLDAYVPVVISLLDAGLVATACFPCPAEMAASIHIARTKSSVMDAIVCARTPGPGVVPFAYDGNELAQLLEEQTDQLASAGVTASGDDRRCMSYGLSAVAAVTALASRWRQRASVMGKITMVRKKLEVIVGESFPEV
jgi:hypothetical protein